MRIVVNSESFKFSSITILKFQNFRILTLVSFVKKFLRLQLKWDDNYDCVNVKCNKSQGWSHKRPYLQSNLIDLKSIAFCKNASQHFPYNMQLIFEMLFHYKANNNKANLLRVWFNTYFGILEHFKDWHRFVSEMAHTIYWWIEKLNLIFNISIFLKLWLTQKCTMNIYYLWIVCVPLKNKMLFKKCEMK